MYKSLFCMIAVARFNLCDYHPSILFSLDSVTYYLHMSRKIDSAKTSFGQPGTSKRKKRRARGMEQCVNEDRLFGSFLCNISYYLKVASIPNQGLSNIYLLHAVTR